MDFGNIHYLWLLLIVPIFAVLSTQSYLKSNKWLYLFARKERKFGPHLLITILICSIIVVITLSLAEPKFQYEKTFFNRAGIEIAIGIDVSKSMLAEDISFPIEGRKLFNVSNRLNRSRYFLLNTLSQLHGERIALFIFAREGVEIVPLTGDYGYCNYIIKHINDANITLPGSDLGEAIKTGISMLEASPNKSAKTIVLISDGEDISQDRSMLYESAQSAANKGIRVFTAGIGTSKGVLIPIRNEDETSILNYYLDEDGTFLKTKLERDTLIKISEITKGRYFHVTHEDASKNLVSAILQDAKISSATKSIELAWLDLSPFFIMVAVLLVVAEIFARRSCRKV